MKRFAVLLSTVAVVVLLCGPINAAGLSVGDKAPALSVSEWVKGDPVDLARDASRRVHMVEFWATWCPPCKATIPRLTEFQKKYGDRLAIIGVTTPDSIGNTPSAVRRFVRKLGAEMDYRVAIDNGTRTSDAYMRAAGVSGIPHAFIVGKSGNILWQGSPLDPSLEDVLTDVVEGTYDLSRAKVQAEVERRFQALELPAQMGQFSVVWDGLVGILKLDPSNAGAIDVLVQIYTNETQDKKAMRDWASTHIATNRNNVLAMQRLAAALSSGMDMTMRMPDLALEAAKAAYEGAEGKDALATALYARAVYQVGDVDRAIALQEDAVAAASAEDRELHREILEYFRLCRKLRDGLK